MMRQPTLFLTVGLPGTGKTTAARRIESEQQAFRPQPLPDLILIRRREPPIPTCHRNLLNQEVLRRPIETTGMRGRSLRSLAYVTMRT